MNSSLIGYGIERNISPYDIHHAKSKIVNNEILAKIVVFYGIQKFILCGYSKYNIDKDLFKTLFEEIDEDTYSDEEYNKEFFERLGNRSGTFWDHQSLTKKNKRNRAQNLGNNTDQRKSKSEIAEDSKTI